MKKVIVIENESKKMRIKVVNIHFFSIDKVEINDEEIYT